MTRNRYWTIHGNNLNRNQLNFSGSLDFGDGDSGSSSSSLVRHFDLHRPTVVPEPVADLITDEGVELTGLPQKRMRVSTYMDVISKSSVRSWKEQRDSMWEVAIRRWHSCAMT